MWPLLWLHCVLLFFSKKCVAIYRNNAERVEFEVFAEPSKFEPFSSFLLWQCCKKGINFSINQIIFRHRNRHKPCSQKDLSIDQSKQFTCDNPSTSTHDVVRNEAVEFNH